MKRKSASKEEKGRSPSQLIDARIKELDDWRSKTLSHVRALIKQADPEVVEVWKWRGVPPSIVHRIAGMKGSTL